MQFDMRTRHKIKKFDPRSELIKKHVFFTVELAVSSKQRQSHYMGFGVSYSVCLGMVAVYTQSTK